MNIEGTSNYDQAAQLAQLSMLSAVQAVDTTQTGSAAAQTGIQPTADKATFSQTGQMMSQLAKLQTSDPAQFKAVTQGISEELSSQAKNSQDPMQSQVLSSLSKKFAQASQTGSMSALGQHHGGGGHGSKTKGAGGGDDEGMSAVFSTIAQDIASVTSNAGSGVFSMDGASLASNAGLNANQDPAQMMRELERLRETDPAQFKAVTQKISDDLATQAANSTDPAQSHRLTDMSAKFAQASQTGQMPALKSHGHGHGHGSHGKSGKGETGSLTDALDSAISSELAALSNSGPGVDAFSSLGSGLSSTNPYVNAFLNSQTFSSTLDFSSLGATTSV